MVVYSIVSRGQAAASKGDTNAQLPCSLLSTESTRASDYAATDLASASNSSLLPRRGRVIRSQAFRYNTIFGYIEGATVFREVPNDVKGDDIELPPMRLVQAETRTSFSVSFIRRVWYWRKVSLCGNIERRWTVYKYDEESVLWDLCQTGDVAGLQRALSNGCSPHIVRPYSALYDEEGYENLLHVR